MFAFFLSPYGRINRAQWWGASILLLLVAVSSLISSIVIADRNPKGNIGEYFAFIPLLVIFGLLAAWINFCLTVKRLHDRNKSGWWYLVSFIPIVGSLWHFIECGFLPGDKGPNQYGPPIGRNKQVRYVPPVAYNPSPKTLPKKKSLQDSGGLPNRVDRAVEEAILANRKRV